MCCSPPNCVCLAYAVIITKERRTSQALDSETMRKKRNGKQAGTAAILPSTDNKTKILKQHATQSLNIQTTNERKNKIKTYLNLSNSDRTSASANLHAFLRIDFFKLFSSNLKSSRRRIINAFICLVNRRT